MKNVSKDILSFIFITQIKPLFIPFPLIFLIFGIKKILAFIPNQFFLKGLKIFKNSLILRINSLIFLGISIISFLANLLYLEPDFYGVIWFSRDLLSFLILPFIALSYFSKLSIENRDKGIKFFFLLSGIYLIVFFTNRELASKIDMLTYQTQSEENLLSTSILAQLRVQLLGFQFFGGAISFASISCLTYFYYYKNKFNLRGIGLIFFAGLISVLMARSSVYVFLIFSLILIFYMTKNLIKRMKINIYKFKLSSILIFLIIIFASILSINLLSVNLPKYYSWLTEGIPLLGGEAFNSSLNDLKLSWAQFLTFNINDLIFPSFRLFENGTYFKRLDIGYARLIFYLGLPGFIILISSFLSFLKVSSSKFNISNLEINFIILVTFIAWFKGIYWPIQPFAFLLYLRVRD